MESDYLNLAEHYLNTNKPTKALDELAKVNSHGHKFWYVSAQCYFDLRQFKKAKYALQEGLKDNPDDLYLLFLLVNTERRLGLYKNAEKYVNQLRTAFPERADVLELNAKVLLDLKKFQAMHKVYIKAIKIRGESPNSLLNASVSLMYAKPKTAIKHIKEAISQNPENAYSHSIAAHAYKDIWQLDKFLEHANQAAKLMPEERYYHYQVYRAKVMTHIAYKPLVTILRFNHKYAGRPSYLFIGMLYLLWAIGIGFEKSLFSQMIVMIGFGSFVLFLAYWAMTNIILKYTLK